MHGASDCQFIVRIIARNRGPRYSNGRVMPSRAALCFYNWCIALPIIEWQNRRFVYGHRRVFRRGRTWPRRYAVCPPLRIVPYSTPSVFAHRNLRILCVKAINIEIRGREFVKFTAAEDSAVSFLRRNRVSADLLHWRIFRAAIEDQWMSGLTANLHYFQIIN